MQRLDRVAQNRFSELKALLDSVHAALAATGSEAAEPGREELLKRIEQFSTHTYPEVLGIQAAIADRAFMLDCVARDFKQQNRELRSHLMQLEIPGFFKLGISNYLPHKALRKVAESRLAKRYLPEFSAPKPREHEGPALELSRSLGAVREAEATSVRANAHSTAAEIADSDLTVFEAVENVGSAFQIFSNWVSLFHFQGKRFGSKRPYVTDAMPHLAALDQSISFAGKRVLEIGPFEAGNSKQMLDLGAASVTGIEANPEAYLKCALVKNEFRLDNFEIVFGDCNSVLSDIEFRTTQRFDICVAAGVLYHMHDPLRTIDLLCATAPVLYVRTHVASDAMPEDAEWTNHVDADNRSYRVKENLYGGQNHWGGVAQSAFWLGGDDLIRAFEQRGFNLSEIVHEHGIRGDAMAFVATRRHL